MKIGGVTVVNSPKSGHRTVATVNIKLWFIMAVAGMVLGMGIAVLKLLLFPSVYNARSVENNFKLKVIG